MNRLALILALFVAAMLVNPSRSVYMYECRDKQSSANCRVWAGQQQCEFNVKFMIPQCCQSCVDTCGDTRRDCAQKAKRGGCGDSKILLACKLSCGLCCSDYHAKCAEWARKNQCAKNPKFMLKNCLRSCQACSSPCKPCTNSQYSEQWKIQGFTIHAEAAVFYRWPKLAWALKEDLGKLKSRIPSPAAQLLQKLSGLFISRLKVCNKYPRCAPPSVADSYHVSKRYLQNTQDAPMKAGFVDMMNPGEYMYRRSYVEKYNLLHEFFHAWFDIRRRAGIARDRASQEKVDAVKAAFNAAKRSGRYRMVNYAGGGTRPGYQIESYWEYMGELSEAFFARGSDKNDYYPYNREQLKQFDPRGYQAILGIWSGPYPVIGRIAPAGSRA